MLYSNYNTLTLPHKKGDKYKVGDIYSSETERTRERRFDGLEIKAISFCFGVVLHFDYEEWKANIDNL